MKTILPLMFCGYLSKAAYVMPDVNYDQTQATCDNAQALIGSSTADLDRLKYAIDTVIPLRIHRLDVSKKTTQKVCGIQTGASMLLQKSKVKAGGSLDGLCSNIEAAIDTLSQQLKAKKSSKRSMKKKLQRLDDVSWSVAKTCDIVSRRLLGAPLSWAELNRSSGKSNDGSLNQACQDVTSAIDQLSDYLEFVNANLQSDYVEGVLPSRIQSLSQKSTACIKSSIALPKPTIVKIFDPNVWEYAVQPGKIYTLGNYQYKVSLEKDTLIEFIANGHSSGGARRLITRFFVDETPIGAPNNAGLNPDVFTFGEFLTDSTSGWQPMNTYQVMVVPKGDHVISYRVYSENPLGARINGLELILKINN